MTRDITIWHEDFLCSDSKEMSLLQVSSFKANKVLQMDAFLNSNIVKSDHSNYNEAKNS